MIPAFRALVQVPHVHVTRMRPRLESCSCNGHFFGLVQIMRLDAALQQETTRGEMMDAGLKAHGLVG